MDAGERHMARSFRFRRRLRTWMQENVGNSWTTLGELHRDAANAMGCAMQTAARWIYQYTGNGQAYVILETDEDYTLALRGAGLAANGGTPDVPTWDAEKQKEKRREG